MAQNSWLKTRAALVLFLFCVAIKASGVVHYVDLNSGTPLPPFTDWSTAATNIQDAIDAAMAGDQILVTNGVYQAGGKVSHPDPSGFRYLTNRVAVDKAVSVQSVNGPEVTMILGNSPLGPDAIRCVYLTNGASLSGFTLTNGATLTSFYGQNVPDRVLFSSGGGILCEDLSVIVSNCVLVANTAEYGYGGMGGGVYSGTLVNCTLADNQAVLGGGAFGSTLINCVLKRNRATASISLNGGTSVATSGGGAQECALTNCTLSGNSSDSYGGGSSSSTLVNCNILGNLAAVGGGVYFCLGIDSSFSNNSARALGGASYSSTLTNCTLTANASANGGGAYLGTLSDCQLNDNIALGNGGGANSAKLTSCFLTGNSAITNGGGAYGGSLVNCTAAGNSAFFGGGVSAADLTNCIVYFNQAKSGTNFSGGTMNFCCTTPLPGTGAGNINSDPGFADQLHLGAGSPCRGAGDSTAAAGLDIDGEPWLNPPGIGCDEFYSGSVTGQLTVAIQSDYANARPGNGVNFTAQISGHASACSWNFGDGSLPSPQPYVAHSWSTAGDYQVTLTAFNADYPAGVSNSITVHVLDQPVLYVAQANLNPVSPFLTWATAATNIQDAVDVTFAGGATILVSNGVYRTGGRTATGVLTNRVCLNKPVLVQSVNGPEFTIIEGYQNPGSSLGDNAVRCAWLCDGSSLVGFTLTNGATRIGFFAPTHTEISGGGVCCQSTNALVANCTIVSNNCYWWGAGAYSGTLSNCVVNNNRNLNGSEGGGGGCAFSTIIDSTLRGNVCGTGGGAMFSVLNNCTIVGNNYSGAMNCSLKNCLVTGNTGTGINGGTADSSIISSNITSNVGNNGGGAIQAVLTDCVITANQATNGGGAYNCRLISCTLSNNVASRVGGGLYLDSFYTNSFSQDVVLNNNSAGTLGGGFHYAKSASYNLTNWSFSGNSAGNDGGGLNIASGTVSLRECAFSNNVAGNNGGGFFGSAFVSDCIFSGNAAATNGGGASVTAASGVGLINCVFAGNSAGVNGGGASVGASLSVGLMNCLFTGNLAAANGGGVSVFSLLLTNCTFSANSAGNGGGAASSGGNGTATNCIFNGNSASANGGGLFFNAGGTVRNSLIVSNQANLGGGGFGGNYYGSTIAGNSAADSGGGLNLGASMFSVTNCLLSGNTAFKNGGGISGGSVTRCVLSENRAFSNGGGTYNSTLNSCTLTANQAGTNGGGAFGSALTGCLLTTNAANSGGGLYGGTLNNCTVVGNLATNAGGGTCFPSSATIFSSIIYYNSAATGVNYAGVGNYNFCCTTPQLSAGNGNLTNPPAFIDLANGNFRLQTNSPCINTGGIVPVPTDLDGRPRVVGGKIDIGAYEFQGPGMGEFIAWLQQSGLPVDGSADYTDNDFDAMNNWQEWIAGTSPTNALSALKMLSPSPLLTGVTVSWQSVADRNYFVERSSDLTAVPAFSSIQSNIVGQAGITTFADSSATNAGPFFYRVGVQ